MEEPMLSETHQSMPSVFGGLARVTLEATGFVDLKVKQPVPQPQDDNDVLLNLADRPEILEVPSIAGLMTEVRRVCKARLKIRDLRIMGHGNTGGLRIGSEWVSLRTLFGDAGDPTNARSRTTQYFQLEKLREFLSPEKSRVVLDHCYVAGGTGR